MNFRESFDRISAEVERLVGYDVCNGYREANEIVNIISKQEGKTSRDLNVIFQYICGKSLTKETLIN